MSSSPSPRLRAILKGVLGAGLLGLAAWPAVAQAPSGPAYDPVVDALTERVAVPAIDGFAAGADALARAVDALAADPTPARLDSARAAFAGAMHAWQRVQPLNFGPLAEDNRAFRIEFWPDKHNTATRQLARLVGSGDARAVTAEALKEGSVAAQGFPALERLLYDDEGFAGDDGAFRLAFARGLAANLRFLAHDLRDAWTEGPGSYAEVMTGVADDDPLYLDPREAAGRYFQALVNTLQLVAEAKLERPLGEAPGDANGRAAESARSGLGAANIRANLETAHALFVGADGGPGLAALVADRERKGLADTAAIILKASIDRAAAIEAPLDEAVATPAGWRAADELRDGVKTAHGLIAGELAGAMSLNVGFNAMDGD